MSGVELRVVPGYQGMSAAQREKLLTLAEQGELRPGRIDVARAHVARAFVVRDRDGTRFLIYWTGEHDRLAEHKPSSGG